MKDNSSEMKPCYCVNTAQTGGNIVYDHRCRDNIPETELEKKITITTKYMSLANYYSNYPLCHLMLHAKMQCLLTAISIAWDAPASIIDSRNVGLDFFHYRFNGRDPKITEIIDELRQLSVETWNEISITYTGEELAQVSTLLLCLTSMADKICNNIILHDDVTKASSFE